MINFDADWEHWIDGQVEWPDPEEENEYDRMDNDALDCELPRFSDDHAAGQSLGVEKLGDD